MSLEYAAPLDAQVAWFYLDSFTGVPNVERANATLSECIGAGVVMAAFLKEGDSDRFQHLVQNLAPDPEYQTFALSHALDYCDRNTLPPVFDAINSLRPETLPLEARVHLMANITRALLREEGTEANAPWRTYKVTTDNLFDQVTSQPYVDTSTATDIHYANRFTDIPDQGSYIGYLTATIDRFVRSPAGARQMNTGFGVIRVGETVAIGALRALHALGFTDSEQQLLNSLISDPSYSAVVTTHVENLLTENNPGGATLYANTLQPNRDDIAHMQAVDIEYAKYLARQGDTEAALAFAENLQEYQARVWIMIWAARYLGAHDRTAEGVALMRQASQLDPFAIEPHRGDNEPYEDPYEDMPEVDEDDLASIDRFNDEAAARATFVQKSAHDLRTERGYTLESIAETAAQLGAFDVALDAYARSRQYPMQTEEHMARIAQEQGRTLEYVRAILACEAMDDFSRPSVLEAALKAFHRRSDRFDDNGTGQYIEQTTQSLVREYTHRQLAKLEEAGRTERLYTSKFAKLLVACGDYKEALTMARDYHGYDKTSIVADIISHKAYAGRTADAIALYRHSPDRPVETLLVKSAMRHIIVNGLLTGDEASARAALEPIPDYSKKEVMGWVRREVGDSPPDVPGWAVREATGSEKYGSKTDVKAVAAAVLRARLVTSASGNTPVL